MNNHDSLTYYTRYDTPCIFTVVIKYNSQNRALVRRIDKRAYSLAEAAGLVYEDIALKYLEYGNPEIISVYKP